MEQKPTVGRIVHVYRTGQTAPLAAIVTRVGNAGVCDLTVFPPGEAPQPVPSVDFSFEPLPGHWSWPPRV